MTDMTKRQYEAMFLFDPTFAGSFEDCEREVRRLVDRAGGEMIFCQLWDERRLAYKVEGRKRGAYVLSYFQAPPDKIGGFERDAQLSEPVLRVLVLRADHVTPEAMKQWISRAHAEERDERDDGGERFSDRGAPDRRRMDRRPRDRDRDRSREAAEAGAESATADR